MIQKLNGPRLRFPEFKEGLNYRSLGSFTIWYSGGTPSKENEAFWNGEIPWITASSMRGTEYFESELKITESGLKNGSRLAQIGSLLILVRGSMLFKTIPIGIATRDVAFNQDVKALLVGSESTPKFILYYLIAKEELLLNKVTGTGIGAGKLDLHDLKSFSVSLPNLPEQQKIASFFTVIDIKISQLKRQLTLLEQYKKGVMQKIFSQEIKFKFALSKVEGDDGQEFPKWEKLNGNDVFSPISNKNHNSDLPILAITQDKGAVPRDMIDYSISVTEQSIESYKVVEVGDFIISLRSFQGGIEYSEYKGICSPAYIILRATREIDNRYFKYYFKTENYISELNKKLEGIRDGKMISYKYFSDIKINVPSVPEQTKIANFLSAIDDKINHTQKQIEKAEIWKKGLMQQMFV